MLSLSGFWPLCGVTIDTSDYRGGTRGGQRGEGFIVSTFITMTTTFISLCENCRFRPDLLKDLLIVLSPLPT